MTEETTHESRRAHLQDLAKQYHDRTREYDLHVCSGPMRNGCPTPSNGEERTKIGTHTRSVLSAIEYRAGRLGFTGDQLQNAIHEYRVEQRRIFKGAVRKFESYVEGEGVRPV